MAETTTKPGRPVGGDAAGTQYDPQKPTPGYYKKEFNGVKLDPYRVICVYGITHPAHQHIVKKALRLGTGHKTLEEDLDEIIGSCNRMKEMLAEDDSVSVF